MSMEETQRINRKWLAALEAMRARRPGRVAIADYDDMSLAQIVIKLQTDFPEPADGDFTITAELWELMVLLARYEVARWRTTDV